MIIKFDIDFIRRGAADSFDFIITICINKLNFFFREENSIAVFDFTPVLDLRA